MIQRVSKKLILSRFTLWQAEGIIDLIRNIVLGFLLFSKSLKFISFLFMFLVLLSGAIIFEIQILLALEALTITLIDATLVLKLFLQEKVQAAISKVPSTQLICCCQISMQRKVKDRWPSHLSPVLPAFIRSSPSAGLHCIPSEFQPSFFQGLWLPCNSSADKLNRNIFLFFI